MSVITLICNAERLILDLENKLASGAIYCNQYLCNGNDQKLSLQRPAILLKASKMLTLQRTVLFMEHNLPFKIFFGSCREAPGY